MAKHPEGYSPMTGEHQFDEVKTQLSRRMVSVPRNKTPGPHQGGPGDENQDTEQVLPTAAAFAAALVAASAAALVAAASATAFVAATSAAAAFVASAAATSAAAVSTATATATARAGFFWFGWVHAERASVEIVAVEGFDRRVELGLVAERDEGKALGLSGFTVSNDIDSFDRSEIGKETGNVSFCSSVGQVAHVDVHCIQF
jgi:hypothetical protein